MGAEQDEGVPGRRGASAALQYVTGRDSGKADHRRKRHPVLSQSGAHHCPSQRGTCIYVDDGIMSVQHWDLGIMSVQHCHLSVCVHVWYTSSPSFGTLGKAIYVCC